MSEHRDLKKKLRRLRREGPSKRKGEAAASDPAVLPVWLERRLAAKAGAGRRAGESEHDGVPGSTEPLRDLDCKGGYAARVERYGNDHVHGSWALREVDAADRRVLADLGGERQLEEVDPADAVYLDIETTGLSGGAGTIPFLVALGSFTDGAFELWQGFLRGPEEEEAMLREVARRVSLRSTVISFFGKSFDRHRIEDKMRLYGIEPPFDAIGHLDLYHPLARLYTSAFPDGRLATMEARLCGVERVQDLPGSQAPAAWFDFLAGRPHRLERVFQHNADDVLSLVTLAGHLGRTLSEDRADGTPLEGPGWSRARGLARYFAKTRRRKEALIWAERAIERRPEDDRAWRLLRADLLRLEGDWREALEAYEELLACTGVEARVDEGREAECSGDEVTVHALVQVAKLSEHRLRDRERALSAVERARAILAASPLPHPARRLSGDLERRRARLSVR